MPYIDVVAPESADGELAEIYTDTAKRRGSVANVLRIHSLQPRTLRTHLDLYLSILYGRSGLSRREREAIAVTVSHANQCSYCVSHHRDALAKYEDNKELLQHMATDGVSPLLTPREAALVQHARALTLDPAGDNQGRVKALRDAGLGDEEILTATMTTAYFNFVNRMVLGLGVDLEEDEREYRY